MHFPFEGYGWRFLHESSSIQVPVATMTIHNFCSLLAQAFPILSGETIFVSLAVCKETPVNGVSKAGISELFYNLQPFFFLIRDSWVKNH